MEFPRLLKLAGAFALLGLVSGCQFWNAGGSTFQAPKQAFSMQVPTEWSYSTALGSPLVATRDGLALQSFLVRSDKLNKALQQSERTLTPGLSAYELAEIIVDDMKVDPAFNALAVLSNEPALIGGQPGFKVTLTYRNARNLHLTETRYGVIHENLLWTLSYVAPRRHYHARDLAAFEAAVATFQFGPEKQ